MHVAEGKAEAPAMSGMAAKCHKRKSRQFVKQCFCICQIGHVEALCEPCVTGNQNITCFVGSSFFEQKAAQGDPATKFEDTGLLLGGGVSGALA